MATLIEEHKWCSEHKKLGGHAGQCTISMYAEVFESDHKGNVQPDFTAGDLPPNTQHPTSTWTTSFSHLEKYILRNAR